MPERDTATLDISRPAAVITLERGGAVYPATGPQWYKREYAGRLYPRFISAIAASLFFSTASVLNDPRTFFYVDSSVVLGAQRPARRKVSLWEARQLALQAFWSSERRRAEFAELEGREFEQLYRWEVR